MLNMPKTDRHSTTRLSLRLRVRRNNNFYDFRKQRIELQSNPTATGHVVDL
jgi:hypothetical protein